MTPEQLISECQRSGISIRVEGEKIKLRGSPQMIRIAADRLRPYKAEVMQCLTGTDTWGPYTTYCCPVSPTSVKELDELITRYAQVFSLSAEATARIIEAARKQSAALVPNAVNFFKHAIERKSQPENASSLSRRNA